MLKISKGFFGIAAVLSLATLSIPATAAISPRPGVVNYVEGNANIDGRNISFKDVGSAVLDPNQVLTTGQGKVEVLLTPGVLLRVSDNSSIRMISTRLVDPSVELLRGEAMVEATDLRKENHITILERGATTTLAKNGLYSFNADLARVSVFEGEAKVQEDDHTLTVKKGKAVNVTGTFKTASFNRDQVDELYRWSSIRSQYASQANLSSAGMYYANPGYWNGAGWYWNPYFDFYSFIPGSGFLYSPFGYGFYSPFVAPYVVYGGRGGVFRGGVPVVPNRGAFHSSAVGASGFRGGTAATSGFRGGFSGGGGFHGGGGGGRR